ncbi:MAG: tetratricopeptide repeat protein [Xanthobacteraceae bacterium]
MTSPSLTSGRRSNSIQDKSTSNNRGHVYADKGDYNRAIADYTEAILLDPNYERPYKGRGAACQANGDDTDVPQELQADKKEQDRLNELINFPLIGEIALRFDLPHADEIRIEGEVASQIAATLVKPLVPNKTLLVDWNDLSKEDERERDLILVGVLLAFAVGAAIEAIRPRIAIINPT